MRFAVPIVFAAAATLAGCANVEMPNGATLLSQSHQAEEGMCYRVRKTSEVMRAGEPRITVNDVMHNGRDKERVEISPANNFQGAGIPFVVAHDGTRWWRLNPAERWMEVWTEPRPALDDGSNMALLFQNYNVLTTGVDRVAGRPAYILELRPHFSGRPMTRIWLDRERFFKLRQEEWGPNGHLLSASQVVAGPWDCPASSEEGVFSAPIGLPGVQEFHGVSAHAASREAIAASVGFPVAVPAYLPAGFVPTGTYLMRSEDSVDGYAQSEITDGMVTVLILQMNRPSARSNGIMPWDDSNGAIALRQHDGYQYLVRGNLRRSELVRIADGMTIR